MCRSGCRTKDHQSWGACLKAANVKAQWLGGTGMSYGDEKAFYQIDTDYRAALDAGVDPGSFERKDVDAALRAADAK